MIPSYMFILSSSYCLGVTGSRELFALSLVVFVCQHFFVCFLAADPAVKDASTQNPRDAQNQMTSLQVHCQLVVDGKKD